MSFLVRFGGKSGEFGHGETGSIQNTHCNEPDMPPNSTRKSTIKNFPYPNSAQMTMISQDTRAVETASDWLIPNLGAVFDQTNKLWRITETQLMKNETISIILNDF